MSDTALYGAPDLVLTQADWRDAYTVQDASNLSGVVHSYSQMMSKIWDEANARGGCGANWVNNHPIAILFADKVAHLTGTQFDDRHETIERAYDVVFEKMKGEQP